MRQLPCDVLLQFRNLESIFMVAVHEASLVLTLNFMLHEAIADLAHVAGTFLARLADLSHVSADET